MNLKNFTRKPIFWFIFTLTAALCTLFTIKYFSSAYSIINIKIKMDRAEALKQAAKISTQYNLGPNNYKTALLFQLDSQVRNFAELECGGKDAFLKMIDNRFYMPYCWIVRHFKEHEKNEVYIKFTNEGQPYGFHEVISDDTPGNNLSKEEAQKIAESEAIKNWKINLDNYKLVESSKELKPSKRGDHTFVYERTDQKLGKEGLYRLRIVVSGQKVSIIDHFVKIPESFINKYKEMREYNNAINYAGSFLITILYILFGCIVGLYFLFKKNYIIWKAPILCAISIALLLFIERINILPSVWMSYDTVSSPQNFLLNYIINSLIELLSKILILSISFMAAEGLTRRAFGSHIYLWKAYNSENSSSIEITGRTVSGYLLAAIFLAYDTGIYLFATKFLGWWTPASGLADPNILSNYAPWLTPFVTSVHAGFWEECFFRAIPLSCAALAGKKFGKKNWWILSAFILQALVFGAAHAGYSQQPFYARLVELILPSFMFAGVFLKFGLLPSILTHYLYDLILISLPLFISSSKYAFINQVTIILLALAPICVIIFNLIKNGKFTELKEKYLNKNTIIKKNIINRIIAQEESIKESLNLSKKTIYLLLTLAAISFASYFYFTPFKYDSNKISITQKEAIKIAKENLRHKGIETKKWSVLPIMHGNFANELAINKPKAKDLKPSELMQNKFIWKKDKQLYKKLLGRYLNEPQWIIRFVQFNGSLSNKTEEYFAFIDKNKKIYRIYHKIPEDAPGENLNENKAREITHEYISKNFDLDPKALKEITAKSNKLKSKTTWKFIFCDPSETSIDKTECRIVVHINGNEVSDAYRYVNIPEQWIRNEQNDYNRLSVLKRILHLLLNLVSILLTLIICLNLKFSKKAATLAFFACFFSNIILSANLIQNIISGFDPIRPFNSQLMQAFGSILISALFSCAIFAFSYGLAKEIKNKTAISNSFNLIISSICAGIISIGIDAFIHYFKPSIVPLWPSFENLPGHYSIINIIIRNSIQFLRVTAISIIFVTAINYIHKKFRYSYILIFLSILVIYMAGTELQDFSGLTFWAIRSIAISIVAMATSLLLIKLDIRTLPIISGIVYISVLLQQTIFNAYPYALTGNILAILVVIFLSLVLSRKFNT